MIAEIKNKMSYKLMYQRWLLLLRVTEGFLSIIKNRYACIFILSVCVKKDITGKKL